MTKRQSDQPSRPRLDPETVVRAALELLDDKGAEAVSIRGIAERLGVRMNTVLWHAKTKARLLELMADAIVGGVPLEDLPEPWEERVRELCHRYRRGLLAHRDGAAVVSGTYSAEPATLRFAETMVEALLGTGLPEREAAWACWTLVYFVLGLSQEEQAAPESVGHGLGRALVPGHHPSLSRVVAHFEDTSFDERFDYGLSLILRSLSERAGRHG
ncbi:TetR/AcrR family transcriptional regulator C-terminal domain-containing protein [Streptomyces sp. NPDC006195]|uniref:TetR/AcrR family transcriptional regulator C-terminal domain-containing protein n=1 Tax=unclassified Streptomyces TaxID=2593676 RepID=UPI0033B34416